MSFEPKILGFLCNWCSYAGADLAGVSRVQYPTNIRVIRVMCSGRVDPKFIFSALNVGIDGVIVMGCHIGDCHYLSGNYEAEIKFAATKQMLNLVGLDDRIHLEWVSASEGTRFGKVVTEFTEKIRKLGPSPLSGDKPDQVLLDKVEALTAGIGTQRIRALIGRKRSVTIDGNIYGNKIDENEFKKMFDKALVDEYEKQRILLKLGGEPRSVIDLSKLLNMETSVILKHIVSLKAANLIEFDRIDEIIPYYVVI